MGTNFSITVRRADLGAALRPIVKVVRPKEGDHVSLRCEGDRLLIAFPGGQTSVPCDGSPTGRVRFPLRVLAWLDRSMPDQDPVHIKLEGSRLSIGSVQVNCVFEVDASPPIELPLDPPLWVLLALKINHSEEEIRRNGLTEKIAVAEAKRDELIEKAARTLSPLGIGPKRLSRFVDETIRERSQE